MIGKIISPSVQRDISNMPGFRTKRKLVVIESDDWGSIRMPNNKVFDKLIDAGIDLNDEGFRFNKYDSLATTEDLTRLFDLLSSHKDAAGRPAVFTPVAVVANPDFDKIRDNKFKTYHYEPFTDTLKKYPGCELSFKLWQEGIRKGIFVPQFHGREHLNVMPWLKALRLGHKNSHLAFDNRMWGISTANDRDIRLEFQAAFDFIDPQDIQYQKEVIKSGLDLFEELLGYRATFFVPPNGPFSKQLEPVCVESGIKYLSASKIQTEPLGNGKSRKRIHWPGQKSSSGLSYLTRNCFFEPSDVGKDWVSSCLNEISSAFKWRKPAVISTHRVNYIGALHIQNRENGLKQLNTLLTQMITRWPDVEFVTSEELGRIVTGRT
ncbi:hypothetical protein SAMN06265379_10240 [Saccharicrinis carchari]|uniref:Polysaccharide (De)acetylase n=1 Tax=Saccharicrinis carchari TaxID=1168039 RepID=A0A521BTJ2_SACCC|nr:hypothetical protein [Saccharicrinis carchari]SMO50031.1 hypothetical protein SAMN06265379_10240 [Saccharicrinis carchari]